MRVQLTNDNSIATWNQIRGFVHNHYLANEVLTKEGNWVDHPYFHATGLIHCEDVIYRPGTQASIEIAGNIAFPTDGTTVEIDGDELTIRFNRLGEARGVRILRIKP